MIDKLEALSQGAQYDICGYNGTGREPRLPERFIHHAVMPGGDCMALFKVLQTNSCINDCAYCVNQIGRDCRWFSFQPDELARTFMEMKNKRLVRGLFLTSGIAGNASRTMENMITTVEILRKKFEFKGYIHLKIMPGAPFDCVEEACKLASRVSVNCEAPTAHHLAKLSTRKDLFDGIIERMRWVKKLAATHENWTPSGQTTQFVVGAAGESDHDLLTTTQGLYKEIGLRRVYFSAFNPVSRSRLEGMRPTPPLREHRLYQTDWLLRVYGFPFQEVELALGDSGNLSLRKDPKLVIAQGQPWLFPVDINRASYEELLRVPGIGPTSALRIVEVRKERSINSMELLRKMRVVVKRAAPYIWFKGMLFTEKHSSFLPELTEDAGALAPSLAEACI